MDCAYIRTVISYIIRTVLLVTTVVEAIMQTIGSRIRYLRKKKGVTLSEAARATAISKSNISSFENDKSKPSIDALINLSNYFEVSSDWIIRGDDAIPKKEQNDQQTPTGSAVVEGRRPEYLNSAELDLIKSYRNLTERERGRVDQFVNSLRPWKVPESGKFFMPF